MSKLCDNCLYYLGEGTECSDTQCDIFHAHSEHTKNMSIAKGENKENLDNLCNLLNYREK